MTDTSLPGQGMPQRRKCGLTGWRNRLVASPKFQRWASRFFLTRGIARREGEALFDLVSGFVYSQVLHALVELRLLHRLQDRPADAATLAAFSHVDAGRLDVLLRGGVALGLLRLRRDGCFDLAQKGAAFLGVPGLEAMVLHHKVFYRDLADPVAFLRNETETELADFWPYVFGAGGAQDPGIAATYSNLMADSQGLVADDTLQTVSLSGVRHLMDVGGGTGAFLCKVGAAWPDLQMTLFDLPAVLKGARDRLGQAGLTDRVTLAPGSFRDDPLPQGADAISLVRVLYDHADATVEGLLANVRNALLLSGRIIVSEPMTGGEKPERAGDVYFALYTMAMRTGRARSQNEIAGLLAKAGFTDITCPQANRPFVTSVVTARRAG